MISSNLDLEEDNNLSPVQQNLQEESYENDLRPSSFDQVIGLNTAKDMLSLMIQAAKMRTGVLDHTILHGPPGLGKTSIGHVISKEMSMPFQVTSGPALTKPGDLASLLSGIKVPSIIFIDEIHRLPTTVEEILYPAMEDKKLDIVLGKGQGSEILRIDLEPFTVIGATTRLYSVSKPLRDRFGASIKFDYYNDDDLAMIIKQKAKVLGYEVDNNAALTIAGSSRMTPRIAIRILKRAGDLVVVRNKNKINVSDIEEILTLMGINDLGMDDLDLKIIRTMWGNYNGNPVGLSTIAAAVGEEESTISDVHEPYLIHMGVLEKTPRGRKLTNKGIILVKKYED